MISQCGKYQQGKCNIQNFTHLSTKFFPQHVIRQQIAITISPTECQFLQKITKLYSANRFLPSLPTAYVARNGRLCFHRCLSVNTEGSPWLEPGRSRWGGGGVPRPGPDGGYSGQVQMGGLPQPGPHDGGYPHPGMGYPPRFG